MYLNLTNHTWMYLNLEFISENQNPMRFEQSTCRSLVRCKISIEPQGPLMFHANNMFTIERHNN